ncbi:MAG TPA: YCF48-related protein [Solimonas sp.]|nr:YCF48-related protein [Solimonas sp.]
MSWLCATTLLLAAALGAAQDEPAPVLVPIKAQPAEIMPLAAQAPLLDIVDTGRHLVAVGDRGNIVVSNDGRNWTQVESPVRAMLTAVSFAGPLDGWAVGHDAAILHTADGGRSWALQNFQPELEKPLLDVLFIDRSHGFAVGAYGLYYRTADGGQNWEQGTSPAGEQEAHLHAITRLASGVLLVVGEQGLVAQSTDGGASWRRLHGPRDTALYGALPQGPRGALVFGARGEVWGTADAAGGRWLALPSDTRASLFGGTVVGQDGGIVLVGAGGAARRMGGGRGSAALPAERPVTLSAVTPFGDGLLAVGESGVMRLR